MSNYHHSDEFQLEVLQVPSELESAVRLYQELSPQRVLEVGCWQGGTLRKWLAGNPKLVVAVDLDHQNQDAYEEWRHPSTKLVIGEGSSYGYDMAKLIKENAPYDWAFIDGDHSLPAVQADVDIAWPLINPGGVLVLHDITPAEHEETVGPGIVFDQMKKAGYRTEEFVCGKRFPWSAGIGVVYKSP